MLIHPKLSYLLCQECDICQLWRFSTLEGIHSHIWKHACILKIVPNIVTIISKQEASTDQENIYKQRQSWQESPWRREVMTWQFNRLLDLFITCWWAKHTTLSKFDTQADLKSCAVLIIPVSLHGHLSYVYANITLLTGRYVFLPLESLQIRQKMHCQWKCWDQYTLVPYLHLQNKIIFIGESTYASRLLMAFLITGPSLSCWIWYRWICPMGL